MLNNLTPLMPSSSLVGNPRNSFYFSSIGILLERHALLKALQTFCKTKPVWGICAGAILLSNTIKNPELLGNFP